MTGSYSSASYVCSACVPGYSYNSTNNACTQNSLTNCNTQSGSSCSTC